MRYNKYRSNSPPSLPAPEIISDVEVVEIQPLHKKEDETNLVGSIKNIIKKITGDFKLEDLLLIGLILLFMTEDNDDDMIIPILIYIYLG